MTAAALVLSMQLNNKHYRNYSFSDNITTQSCQNQKDDSFSLAVTAGSNNCNLDLSCDFYISWFVALNRRRT